ncbi:MAG TPA: hypothetical protein VGW57_16730 [Chthoniobacterales bacterium]|nr:hypothetical protein [Chthoniobacterales bacterium]
MTLILAFCSGLIIVATFIADQTIKRSAKNKLDKTDKATVAETNEQTRSNLEIIALRNRRLSNLSLLAFGAVALVQLFSILNASNNQTQKNMDDIKEVTTRVTKIERYLWGDGGNVLKNPPPSPTDLLGRVEDIERKLEDNVKNTNANANSLKQAVIEMRAQVEELKQLVAASGRRRQAPAHAR